MAELAISLRATSGFVTDGAGTTYCLGEAYPVTRGGLTFGFSTTSTANARDRSTAYPKSAGIVFNSNGGATRDFKVDLPSGAGIYKIRLGCGDPAAAQAQKVVVKDGATVLGTLTASTAAGSIMDSSGAVQIQSAWNASNPQTNFTFSGTQLTLTLGDTVGTLATTLAFVSVEFVSGGGDTTLPVQTGSMSVTSANGTSIGVSWPAGTDNVAVTSYEVSSDNGTTYTDTGSTALTYTFTGLTPSTSYTLRVRAKDAASNVSTPALSITQSTTAADVTAPTQTGAITVGTVTSSSIAFSWPVATDNIAVTSYEVSKDGGSTWTDTLNTLLTYTFTGLAASTSFTIKVRAKDAAGNVSTPALSVTQSTSASSDVIAPTLTGSISITQLQVWGFRATWPAASDNVLVTGYEASTDGGTTYTDLGDLRLVKNFVNHAWKGTTVQLRIRAYDAAGNRSAALSSNVAVPTDAGSTVVTRSIGTTGTYANPQAWNDAAPQDLTLNVSSTCQAGSTTTAIVLNAGASATVGAYVNNTLTIAAEVRLITAYNESTKTATVGPLVIGGTAAFSGAPSAGAAYTIGPVIWKGECQNQEFIGTYPNSTILIQGSTTSPSAYKWLTAAAGAAWCDNASKLTNALRYDNTKGACITVNMGNLGTQTVGMHEGYCRVSRLQVQSTGNGTTGWGGYAVHSSAAEKPVWLDQCIVESGTWDFVLSQNYGSHLTTNCVVIATRPASAQATHTADSIAEMNNGAVTYNTVFVAVNGQNYQRATVARVNSCEFVNCGFFGCDLVQDLGLSGSESPGPRYQNCYSSAGSLPTNVTAALFNTTSGSGFENITFPNHDLRIKSTSALKDAGVVHTAIPTAVDAAGTTRPQGTSWDVGPWELVQAVAPGVITTDNFRDRDYGGTLLASTLIPTVLVINPSTRAIVLTLTNQTTDVNGQLTITSSLITAGVTYLVVAFNSTASASGSRASVAA